MAKRSARRGGCRKYLQSLGTIVIFAILFLIAGAFFFYRAIHSPYKGYSETTKEVEVKKGVRTAAILRHLQQQGVLRDEYLPLIYLKIVHRRDSIKAGVYTFSRALSPAQVLDKLTRGDVILKSVTVREGLDRFAVGQLMSAEGFGTVEQWEKLTADPELIHDLAPDATTLEGYLFPDTYKLTPGTSARAVVQLMVQDFRKHFSGEMAYITTGLTPHQTVVLASIVETEARRPEERPLVASVYLNRFRKQMLLGADPTVIYAIKLAHRWDGNIHKADLQIDSPYNTYRFHGFPPGPIANPGVASLKAAAAPAKTTYLYFVAKNDGSHAFSTSLAEHNRNVEIYQRQYFRNLRNQQ